MKAQPHHRSSPRDFRPKELQDPKIFATAENPWKSSTQQGNLAETEMGSSGSLNSSRRQRGEFGQKSRKFLPRLDSADTQH
jgi:hypothetical protein